MSVTAIVIAIVIASIMVIFAFALARAAGIPEPNFKPPEKSISEQTAKPNNRREK